MFRKMILSFVFASLISLPSSALNVDFVDASVMDIAQILAREAGFDLVVSGDQATLSAKRATVHLNDVSPEEALENILSTNGINYEKKGRAILISTLPQDISSTAFKGDLEVIELKHLSAQKVSSLLKELMPDISSATGQRANCLVLRGRKAQITEARGLISKIDKQIPQILIESQVLEVSHSDTLELGLSYGDQTAGIFTFLTNKDTGKTGLAKDLKTTLNVLMGDGRANVVATPRIATLDD
ncbi:MAG: hypothetical protein KKH83_06385, partial [Candidatus Margulisbacteria bacterium]|nr:hypothetical protein [Candidatus Margulisiibacteriota bacterium]